MWCESLSLWVRELSTHYGANLSPAALFQIQLLANLLKLAVENVPSMQVPANHLRELGRVPGTWLQPVLSLTIAAIWEVNQQTSCPHAIFPCLCRSVF